MKRIAILVAACVLPAALGGCGLHPLYGGGVHSSSAQLLSEVEVAPIGGQSGWLVRTALLDRLSAAGHATPRYRLEVELQDQIVGLGINDQNTVTRERRSLRARFRLVDTEQASAVVVDATAGSDAGLDVTSTDYSTLAAEQTSLENLSADLADQIVARVALYAKRTGAR